MPARSRSSSSEQTQSPETIAGRITAFLAEHAGALVLEDGKRLFDMQTAGHSISTAHGHCTLHLWNEDGNTVRRIVSAEAVDGALRLSTLRLGQPRPKLLELLASPFTLSPAARNSARTKYLRVLERTLERGFPQWKPSGFRSAMDLERSFGPAYARGSLLRGNQAWAVIGVNEQESVATIDGILTLGILWLHHCREHAGGRRLYQGLRVVVPRGTGMLTKSRLRWLHPAAAKWELFEFDERTEELIEQDADDTGNLRTRLVHRPDEALARERFGAAAARVLELVPSGEQERVEQHLRSATELAFLLHGLEFARAHVVLSNASFRQSVEITVGVGPNETILTDTNRDQLRALIADLFRRRRAIAAATDYRKRGGTPSRRIGASTRHAAHFRLRSPDENKGIDTVNPQQDPLYRAVPERWLESVLRKDLQPLTRGLAPSTNRSGAPGRDSSAHAEEDGDGNRSPRNAGAESADDGTSSRVIPRLDARHVYAQVPAIAGTSDRGMLDLLGISADGRLAVIELKADDDLQLALQGLDYWIRVRHHHRQAADPATGLGEFQRHGYFKGVELSPLPPRLYLVAPALHIHPATETILRYLSPAVEWHLLALDERWRHTIRVVWRKSGGRSSNDTNSS